MKKLLFAAMLAFALPLGSCASTDIGKAVSNLGTAVAVIQGTQITQNQLNAAVAAYDTVVLRPYNVYRYLDAAYTVERRRCTVSEPFTVASPCAKQSVLAKIQPSLQAVEDARVDLQGAVTACAAGDTSQCKGMKALIMVFNSAVTVVKSALAKNGVA